MKHEPLAIIYRQCMREVVESSSSAGLLVVGEQKALR